MRLASYYHLFKNHEFFNKFGLVTINKKYSKIYLSDFFESLYTFVKFSFGDHLVIQVRYPGLGDHLFYSVLPELLIKNNVFKKVYISNKSEYRFSGIKDLVWGNNPFVSGFVDGDGWSHSGIRPVGSNFVDGINNFFRVQDVKISGTSPKVYYQPLIDQNLRNKILVDLNSFSNQDSPGSKSIVNYLLRFDLRKLLFVECDKASEVLKMIGLSDSSMIGIPNSLFTYCNYIFSSEKFICLYSGGNSLAPALNKKAVVLCKFIDPAQSYNINQYVTLT